MSGYKNSEYELKFAAWCNAIINTILTGGKGIVGVAAGSQALLADAIHSAADVAGSLAVIIGLRIAKIPPDVDHPYGHGRAEVIAASIVAGFLVAAGLNVMVNSVKSLLHPAVSPHTVAAFAAFVAVVIKEFLYHYNFQLGTRLHSKSMIATAYDHRSDVFSSFAALVGIGLSIWGHRVHLRWLMHMDAVAGFFVALLILKMAYGIAQDSLQTLMDRVILSEAELASYQKVILDVAGVRHVDGIRVRDHGQYVVADVEICVDAKITVDEGHGIAAEVRKSMIDKFQRVQDVFVHVNPYYGEYRENQ